MKTSIDTNPTASFLSADWSKNARKRSVHVADVHERRICRATCSGWNLPKLLALARERVHRGPVLIGIDLAIGLPAPYWRELLRSGAHGRPSSFVEWLGRLDPGSDFFRRVRSPREWSIDRPFFHVPSGAGGLKSFTNKLDDGFRRCIDVATGAKSLFAVSGIPGVVGSATRAFWKELIPLLRPSDRDFAVWPFEGEWNELLHGRRIVLAETYPALAYGVALAGVLPTNRVLVSKTKPEQRRAVCERIKAARWVERGRVDLGDLDPAKTDEDAFDSHLTAAAVLRCMLDGRPLVAPDWIAPIAEGAMLLAGPVDPNQPAKKFQPAEKFVLPSAVHSGRSEDRGLGRIRQDPPTAARNRAMRFFNTAGPVNPDDHYCIPPLERFDLDEVLALVRMKKYFVLHAPRQTGKTSALLALRDLLNGQGYACVYTTVETARTARDDVGEAMRTVLAGLSSQVRSTLGDEFPARAWSGILADFGPNEALGETLKRWSEASAKPLVLLVDEIDTLQGDPLLSTLQQLRGGYPMRPGAFPQSVVLCGLRDVRDYRIRSTSSPFNVVAKSLRLGDFTQDETLALLGQHTAETGQAFTSDAREALWTQTLGQPWLVNALAYETCFERKAGRDRGRAVTADDVAEAREALVVRRVTHLDQLADKLREDRVRRVVEPMLSGADERRATERDVEYVRDLGLIARDMPVRIANPIYAEVVPRELGLILQEELDLNTTWYVDADGGLDVDKLLGAFQDFFRRHSEHWKNRFLYEEAWPQILLQAYLHRVVNSGGRIEREYGLGRGRVDLLITWPHAGRVREYVVECKVVRAGDGLERTIGEGVEQTAGYMARCAAEAGHLVVIDQREGRSWEEKVFHRQRRSEAGTPVDVWGM